MTQRITDLTGLVRGTGAGAESQQTRELTLRGEVAQAPAAESDYMVVVAVGISRIGAIHVPPGNWAPRGTTLPVQGNTCLIVFDDVGDAFVPVWSPY